MPRPACPHADCAASPLPAGNGEASESVCLALGAADAGTARARLREQARRLSADAQWECIAGDDAFALGQYLVAMQHYGNGASYRHRAAAIRNELDRTDPPRDLEPSRSSQAPVPSPRHLFEPERLRRNAFAQRPFGVRPSGSTGAADDVPRRAHAPDEDPPYVVVVHAVLALVIVLGPFLIP